MKRWQRRITLFALVGCVVLLGACGDEKNAGTAQDGDASDARDATQTKEASKATTGVDLPDGFPPDIPLYTGAKFVRSASQPGGIVVVKLTSGDPVTAIAKFYRDTLAESGWKDRSGMDNPAGGTALNFEKNDTALTVQLTERPNETLISLNVATNK